MTQHGKIPQQLKVLKFHFNSYLFNSDPREKKLKNMGKNTFIHFLADFDASFPQVTWTDYVIMESFSFPELSSLTLCLWERSPTMQSSKMCIFRYSVSGYDDALVIEMDEMSGKLDLTVRIDDERYITLTEITVRSSQSLNTFTVPSLHFRPQSRSSL